MQLTDCEIDIYLSAKASWVQGAEMCFPNHSTQEKPHLSELPRPTLGRNGHFTWLGAQPPDPSSAPAFCKFQGSPYVLCRHRVHRLFPLHPRSAGWPAHRHLLGGKGDVSGERGREERSMWPTCSLWREGRSSGVISVLKQWVILNDTE